MLVHVGEYCEVVCVSTAVQTVVEQQILSKIPDALKLSKYVQNCEIWWKSADVEVFEKTWTVCYREAIAMGSFVAVQQPHSI